MSWLTRNLRQTATLWTSSGLDVYGNTTYNTPVQIKCRWEDGTVKTVDTEGKEIIAKSTVYLSQDVSVDDYLYLGISTSSTPPVNAFSILNFFKTPSLDGKRFERKAVL